MKRRERYDKCANVFKQYGQVHSVSEVRARVWSFKWSHTSTVFYFFDIFLVLKEE